MNATISAVQQFHDFARMWVPPAIRDDVWPPRDNPVTRMVKSIKAITPPQAETVGYGVFSRVYDPEKHEGWEYVRVSLVFEQPEQAENAHDWCIAKHKGDFVICELREYQRAR